LFDEIAAIVLLFRVASNSRRCHGYGSQKNVLFLDLNDATLSAAVSPDAIGV
jgi:hypothetical protein